MNTIVVAIETSTDIASVAVLRGADVLSEIESASDVRHDQLLLPRLSDALVAANVTLDQVELLAVGLGPGSFGGLRVGLSTIKGLALAIGRPVVGVSSLTVLAASAPIDARFVLSLVDAHRGELYACLYQRDDQGLTERVAAFSGTPSNVAARVRDECTEAPYVVGAGLVAHAQALTDAWPGLHVNPDEAMTQPHGRVVGALALTLLAQRGPDDLAALLPIYIRDADAKLPAQALRLSTDST